VEENNKKLSQPQPQLQQFPSFQFIDQHLLPQAFELRARSLEYDVGIHLMPISYISSTLKSLVGSVKQRRHACS